jgi:hypothetical protein
MPKKPAPKASKPRRDDLKAIHASRLRALRLVTPDMKTIRLELEGLAFEVGLAHTRFPNGGGWSYFICPCGRLARTLRLLEARLVCRTCDGLLARCQMEDKRAPIERLITRLEGKVKYRRGWLELSLRRKLIVERERRVKGWKG